jgi:ATP-dependent Clp protease protease subunit
MLEGNSFMTDLRGRKTSMKDDTETPEKPGAGSMVEKKLLEQRIVPIFGEISQDLARGIISKLLALSAENDDDIKVIVCSEGGHVEAGDAIHDFVRFIKPKVIMIGTGWVASAGALIFLAAKKENRVCLPNTRFLLHQPLGGIGGPAADMEIEAREIVQMRRRINEIIARETGQPVEKVEKDTDRNYWIPAKDAVAYGLISRIIEHHDDV